MFTRNPGMTLAARTFDSLRFEAALPALPVGAALS
jgi:hypothetical protein